MPILCPQCKATITPVESSRDDSIICPYCSEQIVPPSKSDIDVSASVENSAKTTGDLCDPWIAAFLAILLPGAGQYYVRQAGEGFIFQALLIFFVALCFYLEVPDSWYMSSFLAGFVWLMSIAHAAKTASQKARLCQNGPQKHAVRFSLRSLMLFILFLSLPLGWYANERYISERMRGWIKSGECEEMPPGLVDNSNALDKIRLMLGISRPELIHADFRKNTLRRSDIALLSHCHRIYSLKFADDQNLSDADLETIAKHVDLVNLHLTSNQMTDKGLLYLTSLQNLTLLAIRGKQITDQGIDGIAQLAKLEKLSIEDVQITDRGLEKLTNLTNLYDLHIDNSQVSDEGTRYLNSFPNLKSLTFGSSQITDRGISQLHSPSLTFLTLDCPKVTGEELTEAFKLDSLLSLTIKRSDVTSLGMIQWGKLPSLKVLVLEGNVFGERSIASFERFTHLDSLQLVDSKISEQEFQNLKLPPSLESLGLQIPSFSDASLLSLPPIDGLKAIDLSKTSITDKGLAYLSKQPNLVSLSLHDTQVTIDGVEQLHSCPQLGSLSLGSPALDEKQIGRVLKLNKIFRLILEGPYFTDKGLRQLEGCKLRVLYLINTQVTKAYADEWQRTNPDVYLSHESSR